VLKKLAKPAEPLRDRAAHEAETVGRPKSELDPHGVKLSTAHVKAAAALLPTRERIARRLSDGANRHDLGRAVEEALNNALGHMQGVPVQGTEAEFSTAERIAVREQAQRHLRDLRMTVSDLDSPQALRLLEQMQEHLSTDLGALKPAPPPAPAVVRETTEGRKWGSSLFSSTERPRSYGDAERSYSSPPRDIWRSLGFGSSYTSSGDRYGWDVEERPSYAPYTSLRARTDASPDLAKNLSSICESPELEQTVRTQLDGPHGAALKPLLQTAAFLAEEMRVTPDFAGRSGGYIGERSRYRLREAFHGARGRQQRDAADLGKAVARAMQEADPVAAVGKAITESFLDGIGLPAAKREGWSPKPEEALRLISEEAFTPLRAMVETIARDPSWEAARVGETALHEGIRHLVEGDFREWRARVGAHHLEAGAQGGHTWDGLSPAQRAGWQEDLALNAAGPGGVQLRTRDLKGPEVLWVGKVGGASHSFDGSGGHRHALSLMLNERSQAVVVEDPRYSDHPGQPPLPAMRIYLKVHAYRDGRRVLIAEHDAMDSGYKSRFGSADLQAVRLAMVRHVVEKAQRSGLPVSFIDEPRDSFTGELTSLGVPFSREQERYLVLPSVSGFESSTRLADHDRAQLTASPASGWQGPYLRRAVVRPAPPAANGKDQGSSS
jgi:hypothetical protein